MVHQSQFRGTPLKDLNLYPSVFLEVCDTLKLNGVSTDAIYLCLFSFSLSDKARAWLHSLPLGCITTWDELLPSSFLQVRWQACGIKSLPSLKRKIRRSTKLRNDSRAFYDYALTMVFKGG